MRCLLPAVVLVLCGGAVCAADEAWGLATGGGASVELVTRDASGAATLTDGELPPTTEEIVFRSAGGVLRVGTIALTNRTVRFSAETRALALRTDGEASMFRLAGGSWTFDGLAFEGAGLPSRARYHGGAIDCVGGALTVTDCTFSRLGARFGGGAVSARLMTGDVTVSESSFATNCCGVLNGSGGAVYASGVRGGPAVRLSLSRCRFLGNAAQNGGAVSTVCTVDDRETPVALAVDGCVFDGNTADYAGGAVSADGACNVAVTTFSDNAAGIQGGALNLGSSLSAGVDCLIRSGTVFRCNRALSATDWACGGAIALWGAGSRLEIDGCSAVSFWDNIVDSGVAAYGGALFVSDGTTAVVSRASFDGNEARDAGGAIYAWTGAASVSTSVFASNTVAAADGFGGAIAADGAALTVTNTTVRFANRGAVSVSGTRLALVNTVVADNGGAADVEAAGNGSLTMACTAYGQVRASASVIATLVTNACLSGVGADVFRGNTLFLDTQAYNPVANEGRLQDATDYRNVHYGPEGYASMGAYQCPAPTDDPSVDIVNVAWYHNRGEGLYYPQVTLRFLGGDATRFSAVTLVCDGEEHALPSACVDRLKTATAPGQKFVFGVDESKGQWVPSKGTPEDFGYIVGWTAETKKEVMLFSVVDRARVAVTVVGTEHPVVLGSTAVAPLTAASPRRLSAGGLPMTVSVPAQFEDFRAGETISGRTMVPRSATVMLYGCAALGDDWVSLGQVEVDAAGRFTAFVPSESRFFQLKAEVLR